LGTLDAQGEDALMEVVINGKGAMPPRGAAPKATDEQLRSVVSINQKYKIC
jgi:cytochrome c5